MKGFSKARRASVFTSLTDNDSQLQVNSRCNYIFVIWMVTDQLQIEAIWLKQSSQLPYLPSSPLGLDSCFVAVGCWLEHRDLDRSRLESGYMASERL